MTTPNKKWWKSKTLWVNTIAAVAAVITSLLDTELVKQNPEVVLWFATILAGINALLRTITTKPITLSILLLLMLPASTFGQYGTTTREIIAAPHEPILIDVDLELSPEESAVTFWRTQGQASYIEVNNGENLAVWAPPGTHSIWLGATITKQITSTIVDGNGNEVEVVTAVSTRKAEFDYIIKVTGAQPPPTDPTDPPVTSELIGPVYHVVIRNVEDVTPQQRTELIKVKDYANSVDDVHYLEFDIDADKQPALSYVEKVPSPEELPYAFVARSTTTGKAYISWQGTFKKADNSIKEIKALEKAQ